MTLRVAHVITGLGVGGAEKVLHNIAVGGREHDLESSVVCLGPPGPVSELLEQDRVDVQHMRMSSVWQFPFALRQLRRELARLCPDIVQGWMYHGNLAATLAGRGIGAPVAWNIRQSLHRPDLFKATTRLTIKANARYSKEADSVIYNSQISREQHERTGFRSDVGMLIPNGVDLDRFGGNLADRDRIRGELGIQRDQVVVIAVGRAHAIKGHDVLMKAIGKVVGTNPRIRFVLAGRDVDWSMRPFSDFKDDDTIRNATMLLGQRSDVADLLAAADIFVSASYTEGFPNAVAEAMASRLPCVATDVGDTRLLLDGNGRVVSAGSPEALGEALSEIAALSSEARADIGTASRARIEGEFSLASVIAQYAQHYRDLAGRTGQAVSA